MNSKALAIAAAVLVLAAIVAGFSVIGSPAKQRALAFDQRRLSDLQTIQGQTINFWQMKNKLPASLADLTDDISGFKAPVDPESGEAYEYTVKSDLSFELCANFKLDSPKTDAQYQSMVYPSFPGSADNWDHGKGRRCFTRSIDPELYKAFPTPGFPGM